MKDIESLLKKQKPLPSRDLQAGFTDAVLINITPKQKETIMSKAKRKFGPKITLASISILVLGGCTAAAIALWPTPKVSQTSSTKLPSGNHIVAYDTENCHYFGSLDGSVANQASEKVYYEVRENSSLTDEQIQNTLQGVCEENVSNNAISALMKELPSDRRGDSSLAYRVDAVSTGSITLSPDTHYSKDMYVVLPNKTYRRFDADVLVYNLKAKSSFDNIKVGDTVKIITKDTSGKSAESTGGYVPANHPEYQVIEAIIKIPALTADPSKFYQVIASDMVRLDPCTTSPTGFCRAYDFVN